MHSGNPTNTVAVDKDELDKKAEISNEEMQEKGSPEKMPEPTSDLLFCPRDVQGVIFSFLTDPKDLLNLIKVCQLFRVVASHDLLWKKFVENPKESGGKSFKMMFFEESKRKHEEKKAIEASSAMHAQGHRSEQDPYNPASYSFG